MWKFLQLLVLPAVLFSGCAKAGGLDWHTLAPMPIAVQEIYPAVHNGKIYVAGGLSDALPEAEQQMTAAVQVYDPAINRWTMAPLLPEARHHAYLLSVDNKLFLFGGFVIANGGRWSASADILQLDETNGVWRKVAQLPKPLTETVAVVLNGNVHFVSGRSPSGPENAQWRDQADVNWHWVFDPLSLTVSKAAPVATPLNSASAVALKQQLYMMGGRKVGAGNLALLQRFDPALSQWQQLAPMPQASGGLAAAALGQHILVFGGEYFDNDGGVYAPVWQYDAAADSWQQQGSMPLPRHGLGAVTLNNKVYVLGGATEAGLKATSAVLEVVTLSDN
ncbi:MAG TPA: galactose oxidase [Rheinheimera sp.]|uniref:Kelch repeat-containing protein n=1 Tax=Rheinheimera sp. TaxID=1869214 RepID=UPI002F9334D3